MKVFFLSLIFSFFQYTYSFAEVKFSNYKDYETIKKNYKLEEIVVGLNYPWGMTFLDSETLLITEKKGGLYKVDINTRTKEKISHNLNIVAIGQGGLLDVLYHNDYVYFSYSHKIDKKFSSTAIARGRVIKNSIKNIEVIYISKPKIKFSDVHFGSRLEIKDNYLFASVGERGKGMIAQDPTQHPGSIIRINLDGSIPSDNPKFLEKPLWLPEIYQIGVRNPQGMTLSPFDNEIYISNHGAMGGDFVGIVKHSGNYGWKEIGWGGKNYNGSKIGDGKPFKEKYNIPLISWVPSIAPSNIQFYNSNMFENWKGDLIVTSLKFNMLIKLEINNNKVVNEKIILQGCKKFEDNCNKIFRMRDIEIDENGAIYIITDKANSSLWKLSK
tara:strand:+ start:1159 stop:2310 length:1152 start_codon:yes stop_codon:yes gene_type:complete